MKRLIFVLLLLIGARAFSNNLQIQNLQITGQNTTEHYTMIQFDISWDNSWRISTGPSNWDAAWVFVKYRIKNQSMWHHATLHYVDGTGTGDGHTVPANAQISSSDDNGSGGAYGVFIYRDSDMLQSSVSYAGVQLRWDYSVDGLTDKDSVDLCVFGIEMVYVPQGSFYVGSGSNDYAVLHTYPNISDAYQITSENAINVGSTTGYLYYGSCGDRGGPIPASYPKGYNAFYCMKYEITQEQYVEFLNKLTSAQANSRYPNSNGYFRHAITGSWENYSTTLPYVACNFLNWVDLAAYLDWAALRPMTELEYEKVARGTVANYPNEFAWGNTSIDYADGILNSGAANETSLNSSDNCVTNDAGTNGPLRVGCLGQGVNTRTGVGAGYYGAFDLSGNLEERVVNIGTPEGRSFDGQHGDGVLSIYGDANVTNWPGSSVTGIGFRGGNWKKDYLRCRVSDRFYDNETDEASFGLALMGGRGVRTAP